jgi:hypothetical protein
MVIVMMVMVVGSVMVTVISSYNVSWRTIGGWIGIVISGADVGARIYSREDVRVIGVVRVIGIRVIGIRIGAGVVGVIIRHAGTE